MEEKYIKFYKTFHKKFKNDKNLIHCFELLSDSGIKRDFPVGRKLHKDLQNRTTKINKNLRGNNDREFLTIWTMGNFNLEHYEFIFS